MLCFLAIAAIAGDVDDDAAGIGDGFDEDRLGLGRDGGLEALKIVGIGPDHAPAEVLVGVVELVDRAAIELLGGDELVARLHQRVEAPGTRPRGRTPPRARPCRLRALRRALPAPHWSGCRCGCRYCRKPAGRTARRRGRHRRRRRTWSDRSAWRLRTQQRTAYPAGSIHQRWRPLAARYVKKPENTKAS
jgi:hypothetical protein